MRSILAAWAVATVVVPVCEASLRLKTHAHHSATNAGEVVQRTGLRQQLKEPVSFGLDAAAKASSDMSKFGPKNCISTWRNEDGHCEVETHCKDQDLSKYAVKFICIETSGEKVRHVFAAGSFDQEEQFDTLIECNKCMAEKAETIEVIANIPEASDADKNKSEGEEQLGGSPLAALRDEVKDLEGFMMNTSAELQKLNAKVYNKNFQPKVPLPKTCMGADCDKVGEKAAAAAPSPAAAPVKLLVSSSEDHQKVQPLRIEVEAARVTRKHRKHIEEDDDDDANVPRQALKISARLAEGISSLAGAVKSAEERDEEAPVRQHDAAPKALSTAAKEPTKPKFLTVALPKSEDVAAMVDAEDEADSEEEFSDKDAVPQSADDFETQESATDARPSMTALQKTSDVDDDDSADVDDAGEDA